MMIKYKRENGFSSRLNIKEIGSIRYGDSEDRKIARNGKAVHFAFSTPAWYNVS